MRGVCAPAAAFGVFFFPATEGETRAAAPGRLRRDKPLRQARQAMAVLCMVVPPHLDSSCLQRPPHLGGSCPWRRGDPRCLKSQEGDAQQMLAGAFPATQRRETPGLSLSKGHCENDRRSLLRHAGQQQCIYLVLKGGGTNNNRKSKCTR